MEHRITLSRFQAILDAYGADTTRWPDLDRAAAVALLKVSAEAQEMFAEARDLDILLMQAMECPPPSPSLRNRILDAIPFPPAAADEAVPVNATSVATIMAAIPFPATATTAAEASIPDTRSVDESLGTPQGMHWISVDILRRKALWVPAAALAASLVLGIVSGAVVQHALPNSQSPSLEQVLSLGFSTQTASLALGAPADGASGEWE